MLKFGGSLHVHQVTIRGVWVLDHSILVTSITIQEAFGLKTTWGRLCHTMVTQATLHHQLPLVRPQRALPLQGHASVTGSQCTGHCRSTIQGLLSIQWEPQHTRCFCHHLLGLLQQAIEKPCLPIKQQSPDSNANAMSQGLAPPSLGCHSLGARACWEALEAITRVV